MMDTGMNHRPSAEGKQELPDDTSITFPKWQVKILSAIQIVLGAFCIALQSAVVIIDDADSAGLSAVTFYGIWLGLGVVACGSFNLIVVTGIIRAPLLIIVSNILAVVFSIMIRCLSAADIGLIVVYGPNPENLVELTVIAGHIGLCGSVIQLVTCRMIVIWASVGLFICGCFGIVAGKYKHKYLIKTTMWLSISNVPCVLILLAMSSWDVHQALTNPPISTVHLTSVMICILLQMSFAVNGLLKTSWMTVLCCPCCCYWVGNRITPSDDRPIILAIATENQTLAQDSPTYQTNVPGNAVPISAPRRSKRFNHGNDITVAVAFDRGYLNR